MPSPSDSKSTALLVRASGPGLRGLPRLPVLSGLLSLLVRAVERLGARSTPRAPSLSVSVVERVPQERARDPEPGPAPGVEERSASAPRSPRFLLTVDDAGQFVVACGARVSIGHVRAGEADLQFLADVGAVHAELVRGTSLRGGPAWRIVARAGERVAVNGQPLGDEPRVLAAGDLLLCGENLVMRYRVPDPASDTVLLELAQGVECEGARTVILFGRDEGGRLRIGSGGQRQVRVPRLEHEITLVNRGDRVEVSCHAGVRDGGSESRQGFSFPCPPPRRIDLAIGRSVGGRPPFGLTIEPPGCDPVR